MQFDEIYEEQENLEYLKDLKFDKRLKKINKKLKDKKVIIYGAGLLFQVINKHYDLSNLNIVGISDARFYAHDKDETYLGYKVYSVNEIKDLNPDCVLVSIKQYNDMLDDLIYDYFPKTKIKFEPLAKKSFWRLLKEILD